MPFTFGPKSMGLTSWAQVTRETNMRNPVSATDTAVFYNDQKATEGQKMKSREKSPSLEVPLEPGGQGVHQGSLVPGKL